MLRRSPRARIPTPEIREWRRTIEFRHTLAAERVRAKNRIRCLLRADGVPPPKGLWSKQGLAWLAAQTIGSDMDRLQRHRFLRDIQTANEKTAAVKKLLDAHARLHHGVQRIQTVPGIDPRRGSWNTPFQEYPAPWT